MPKASAASSSVRRSRKSRKQKKMNASVVPFLGPRAFGGTVPDEVRTTLVYGDVFDLAGGAASFAQNVFRLNSLYDPDQSGVGGTPSGFSTWCSATGLYNRYQVESARITADFLGTHVTKSVIVGLLPGGDATTMPSTGTEFQQAALEKRYPWAVLNLAAYEGSTATLSYEVSMADLLGSNSARDVDNSAQYNGNPAKAAYGVLYCCSSDGATAGPTCQVFMRIEYRVRFFNRNLQVTD